MDRFSWRVPRVFIAVRHNLRQDEPSIDQDILVDPRLELVQRPPGLGGGLRSVRYFRADFQPALLLSGQGDVHSHLSLHLRDVHTWYSVGNSDLQGPPDGLGAVQHRNGRALGQGLLAQDDQHANPLAIDEREL